MPLSSSTQIAPFIQGSMSQIVSILTAPTPGYTYPLNLRRPSMKNTHLVLSLGAVSQWSAALIISPVSSSDVARRIRLRRR